MFQYVFRRLLEAIPVLWVILTITFFMLRMVPGGPFDQEKAIPPEIEENLKVYYGLNEPLKKQYLQYLKNVVRGDLGPSFKYPGWSVNEIIRTKLPVSIELGVYALLFAVGVGIIMGIIAANRVNTLWDYGTMGVSTMGICLPAFVIGPLFILIFSLQLHWVNASGWNTVSDRILPIITLGIYYGAYISRLTRGSLLEVLRQDYVRTARAKGLSGARTVFVHGLRNAITPVISYLGPAAAGLMGGSFVVETVFNIPGLGRFFVTAALNRDYTLVLGIVLCFAFLIICFNTLADILLAWINPTKAGVYSMRDVRDKKAF